MRMIYQQRTSVEMSNAIREQFSALDLGFHMALCTLGGLLFGAEVVTYVWHRVYGLWGNQSHGSKLVCWEDVEAVNQEHENILEQLRRSAGSFENVTNAAKSVEIHLLNSYRRNGYAAEVADIIDTTLRKWIDRLAKPVP
jgi:DNA-binding GntR family transcriptional regulator